MRPSALSVKLHEPVCKSDSQRGFAIFVCKNAHTYHANKAALCSLFGHDVVASAVGPQPALSATLAQTSA